MPQQVADDVAEDRLHRLQALLFEQQAAFNAAQAGRTLNVLFEKPGPGCPSCSTGGSSGR